MSRRNGPIRVYLAARYSRREELCAAANDLRHIIPGVAITSRWLLGNHQIDDAGLSLEAKAEERTRFALEDYRDLVTADWCVSFTEPPRSTTSRGGRHVEYGIALGRDLRCIVVGPRENVFHCLPEVEVYPDWASCLRALRQQRSDIRWDHEFEVKA
jgi:hypothetical protein